jgi:hypothetical protein
MKTGKVLGFAENRYACVYSVVYYFLAAISKVEGGEDIQNHKELV